jgi:hypothetical protein
MKTLVVRPGFLAVICAAVLVAGCGGSKSTSAETNWADQLCSSTTSLSGVVTTAVAAVSKAQGASSVSDMVSGTSAPLKDVQTGIEKLDEVFSSTKILNTPMEPVRNAIGKQLNSVYPVYDSIDAFNSAAKSASSTGALMGPLGGVSSSLSGASQGLTTLKSALAIFTLDKNKKVAAAFSAAPACKSIKK